MTKHALRTPKVSVIVPMYGTEVFLTRCVESILAQTLADIEIILVNDASFDGCGEIADRYARENPKVRVLHHETNRGYGPARNTGMAAATGMYIGFVGSDDWVEASMYERLYDAACGFDADVVFGGYKTMTCGIASEIHEHSFAGRVLRGADEVASLRRQLYGPMPKEERRSVFPYVWIGLYNRTFLRKHSIEFNDSYAEDVLFNIQVCRYAKTIACTSGTDYCYRKDGQLSATNSFEPGKLNLVFRYFSNLKRTVLEEGTFRDECALRSKRHVIDVSRWLTILIEAAPINEKQKKKCVLETFRHPCLREACRGYPFWELCLPRAAFYLCERFQLAAAALALSRGRNMLKGDRL